MGITYRLGKKKDSPQIAALINLASDGVVEYLFHGLIPGMSPKQIVAHNLKNDNYPHSYRSAVVAEDDNTVVGMALSYPSSYHQITDEMRAFFPADRVAHLRHFYSTRIENSWFLDALGVHENYRRRGIGAKLIALTKEKAIENGYNDLTLMVFADNDVAITLYEKMGFERIQQVRLNANEFIKHTDGCWLMKCKINS